MRRLTIFVVLASLYCSSTFAQKELTLESAVNNWSLVQLKRPRSLTWGNDGSTDMPYEAASQTRSQQYDSQNVDGTFALDFTNTRRVWRYNTRGDYYLVNLKTGERRKLGQGLPESSLMFAKFSPDGQKVAYVSQNNIYLEHVSGGQREQLTFDGVVGGVDQNGVLQRSSIINGTFDWVYEEEFDCRDGFRWSGDSKYIAYWQSDTQGTGWFDIINNVDSIYPTVEHFPYPKAGTTNSAVRVGILDVFGVGRAQGAVATMDLTEPTTRWIPITGDSRENYLPRMEFVPGTNRLMIQQMNRAQNTNTLWTCEVVDGEARGLKVLTVDQDSAWVETNDNIHWLAGNKYFTFTSERDGWRHIYRVSADGKQWTCITKGDFDVISEVALDEKRGYLYFMATRPDAATQRYLYRAKLMGNGQCEEVRHDADGQYSYNMSPNCDYAVESFSNASTPTQYRLISSDKKGKWAVKEVLELNDEARRQFESLGLNDKEFVKVKSGDLMLDAWIIKPKNFDPTKKYPVIDYVYGEPASGTVQDRWESTLFWQYLASQGFVVVSIENRGANSPRGRAWRKCIYGEVGVAASEDQARGILDLCRQFPWMDANRIGITGWSGGGSQTLNCMFRYPQIFKTGVAIAFVADQKLYDTIYQERYMNTPQVNPDGYFRGSPINFVQGLEGNLLLIHGTGDDNVHYQNCEMLVNKLIEHNKLFYQVSYPMRTHSISERRNTSLHLRKTIVDFFQNKL